VRAALSRFGPQAGMAEVVERWPEAVGPFIARNAWPARIARDGTVHVNTADSIWAFELGQRSAEIASAVGVPAVRFAPGPLPEAEPEPPAPSVQVAPEDAERARAIASSIEDENLRESVQKAVSFALAKGRSAGAF
jgi:predicted nucleic acid-binding Zn ribbon protein